MQLARQVATLSQLLNLLGTRISLPLFLAFSVNEGTLFSTNFVSFQFFPLNLLLTCAPDCLLSVGVLFRLLRQRTEGEGEKREQVNFGALRK